MKLPAGVVKKRGWYFARIHTKGGEHSLPLGSASDPGAAVQAFYAIRALIRNGVEASTVRDAIRGGITLSTLGQTTEPKLDMTVSATARRWLAEYVDLELETREASMKRSRVETWLLAFMGGKLLHEVRRADIHAYKGHLRTTRPNLEAGTLKHYLRDLRELLNWAVEVELLEASPWPPKKFMPKVEKRPPDRLTDEEVELLAALPGVHGFTIRLALATGLRWGELCRARRRDIRDGQLLVGKTKTGEPRSVPLPKSILAEIMQRGGDRLVPFSERCSGSFNKTIRRRAKERTEALPEEGQEALKGLSAFHVHQARHTFGCRYVEAGGELPKLQEILGHADITMTQRYARPNERSIREDAQRVYERWEGTR